VHEGGLRVGVDHELQRAATDAKRVSVSQRVLLHPSSVDPDAVVAPSIEHDVAGLRRADLGMHPRGRLLEQHDVAILAPADGDARRRNLEHDLFAPHDG
jgi:hypothetical protein